MRMVPGLTNEDVAELMGVQRPTVSTWLHGRRTPPRTTLMIWADMTGVDREWLMTGTPSAEWYAMRDLNPQPADWEPRGPVLRLIHGGRNERPLTVKPRLTLNRRVA